MQHSYSGLYQIHYKRHILTFLVIVIMIISSIISLQIKTYSSYKTYGIYLDNHLYVDIPLDNSDVVTKGNYIKIDNHKYDLNIEEISDLQVNGVINYQTYSLNIAKKFKDNEVVEVTFYYNKQRIMQKIIHIIF